MDKKFKQLLLLNFLIIIELIPAVIILTGLIELTKNMPIFIWLFVGAVLFFIINYLIWRCGKTGEKDRS